MTRVAGILVEHEGHEYLVTSDDSSLPDVLERDTIGAWQTLKKHGPGGRAGATANEILGALGQHAPPDHTQQDIKKLIIFALGELTRKFFVAADGDLASLWRKRRLWLR